MKKLTLVCYALLALAAAGSALLPYPLALWLLLSSGLTLLLYGGDKMAARRGWRRVPERTLLIFGWVGGWPGAALGQRLFRHKTQKRPFKNWFRISVLGNIAALGAVYWFFHPYAGAL